MSSNPIADRNRPVVVVTGASAGVGRATALAFAREWGAAVGLIARSRDALEDVAAEIERLGGSALVLPADVADAEAVEAAAAKAERELGPIDVWINNAMVTVFGRIRDLTPEEVRRVTEVTYLGSVHGTMAALRRMLPRDRGLILQVGSALAYRSIPLQAAYCGAKSAIRGFVDSLRSELIHDGSRLRVTMVHLPAVNTPQFDWARSHMPHRAKPVGAIFDPDDIGHAIVQAAADPKREHWLGFTTAEAIIGTQALPAYADYRAAFTAFEGQETEEAEAPGRPDNLFEPVPGLHRTHGRFTGQEERLSLSTTGTAARGIAILAGLALAGGIGYAARAALRKERA
ncbi:SDR family NAD(P)-dependent oxidoreductase [Azospirillum brasilense]|uniref:SDR family oxidoreductase n=1 Tax=Azospirillum brasilense TaxID=192 RepID=UPI00190C9FCD|nr:SDR family oxidoreductase [Azospirillum brasilense]MBK3732948.1 SDR family NAD(P)-dependent oxidoreductase [Azospirillum brasilense]